jgi:hypothetical protein
MTFSSGFEKKAYSYRREIEKLEKRYREHSKLPKASYGEHMGWGAGIGAVLGTGVGAVVDQSAKGATLGALAGGGIGALIGASSAAGQNSQRAEGKSVMAMSERKRKDHLEYLAHEQEMNELKNIIASTNIAQMGNSYYQGHRFNSGFHKRANTTSSVFKGTAKMLATEGEKALSHHGNTISKGVKKVEEKVLDYSKFNQPRLYNYKPTPSN